jgi:four helix bundle protein
MRKKQLQNQKSKVKKFIDLDVWKNSINLCLEIYKITSKFPKSELFGITNQLRRASSSVGANIAEGFGRYYFKDKIRFYYQSRGSATETQNFVVLASKLGMIGKNEANKLFNDGEKIRIGITGLIKSICNRS